MARAFRGLPGEERGGNLATTKDVKQYFFREVLFPVLLKLYLSSWDVRGLTLEATLQNTRHPSMDMMELSGPVTRDQMEDGEKVNELF